MEKLVMLKVIMSFVAGGAALVVVSNPKLVRDTYWFPIVAWSVFIGTIGAYLFN